MNLSSRAAGAGLAALLALAGVVSLIDGRRDSAIADEPIHVAAGVTQARNGTWLVNVEHPPLAKQVFGLAAVLSGAMETPQLSYRDFFRSTRAYLFRDRPPAAPDRVLQGARLPAIGFFLGLLAAAFWAAGSGAAGLLSAGLLLGNTAFFPHGHLVTTDIPLAFFAVLAAGFLVRLAESPRGPNALAHAAGLAACLALALATKHSAVLLLPLATITFAVVAVRTPDPADRRRSLLLAVVVPAASVLLLSGFLRLYTRHDPPGASEVLFRLYGLGGSDRVALEAMERWDTGLARWAFGLVFNVRQGEAGRLTYFWNGPTAHPGVPYHAAAVIVKSPLPWLLAAAAGAVLASRKGGPRSARFFFLAGLLLFVASLPGPRIGIRHVFPPLALFTLGASSALAGALSRLRREAVWAALLLAVSPLLFGRSLGRNGLLGDLAGRPLLADSNLDWGQDLLRLRDGVLSRGIPFEELSVAYFGGDVPSLRLPGAADLLETDASPRRYVAVSRQLQLLGPQAVLFPDAVPRAARVLRSLEAGGPSKLLFRAGDSIDVYDVGQLTAPAR